MTAIRPLHLGSVHIYPYVSLTKQLTKVQVVSEVEGCTLISGVLDSERYTDFFIKFSTPELIVKIQKDPASSLVKAIMIFSKHQAPFNVTLEIENHPPVDEGVNQKYLEVLNTPGNPLPRFSHDSL